MNFSVKTFCDDIQLEAYGYIEYLDEISEKEASDYELISEKLHRYWCVSSAVYDDGHMTGAIVDSKLAAQKPDDISKTLVRKDVYITWFASKEEAESFLTEIQNA